VTTADPPVASLLLAQLSGLSRTAVKDAMVKGAAWLRRGGRERRLRRATTELKAGDILALYYDPRLLGLEPPPATCLADRGTYSVWRKPAGLLAQGTRYGDHASLLRQAELAFRPERPALLVHRIDREASGLMLVAHTASAARALGLAMQAPETEKAYRAEVSGVVAPAGSTGRIDLPLDGKPALTEYRVEGYEPDTDTTQLAVRIRTGRLHQIRRHLAAIGHPVLGDPRYRGRPDPRGLRLEAVRLSFQEKGGQTTLSL
jgi:tRNA pseudouridine32 synthase/23S rRNA pseudouridine746 synthase